VAIRLNNLGGVLQALGDLHSAQTHFERALAIDEKQLGPDHPSVAIRLNNLGMLFKQLGDMPNARRYLSRAYEIFYPGLGTDHSYTRMCKENLDGLGAEMQTADGAI